MVDCGTSGNGKKHSAVAEEQPADDGDTGEEAHEARLIRAYFQGNPLGLWHTPQWLVARLIEQLPQIEASEQLAQIGVTTTPHLKKRDRASLIRRLRRQSAPRTMPRNPWPNAAQDAAAAAAWFATQGIEVVHAG